MKRFIKYIDVDIRNAINHGGILFKEDGKRIEFNYTKGGKVLSKELLDYEFDKLIDNVFDTASGLLLALCQFINNNINLINIDTILKIIMSLQICYVWNSAFLLLYANVLMNL